MNGVRTSLGLPLLGLVLLGLVITGCGTSNRETVGETSSGQAPPCGPALPVCEQDRCDGTTCSLLEIAHVPGRIVAMTLDEIHVYAIGENGSAIFRLPKCGGQVEVLLRTTSPMTALVLYRDWIYFIDGDIYRGSLYRMSKDGGPSERLDPTSGDPTSPASAITSDATGVYLAGGAPTGIRRFDEDGVTVLQEFGAGSGLLVDDSSLYYQSGSSVYRVDKTGGVATLVVAVPSGKLHAQDATSLYYDNWDGSYGAYRVAKTGGDGTRIQTFQGNPVLATDSTCVYAADQRPTDGGAVMVSSRFPVAGGEAEDLLEGVGTFTFALDARSVYIADFTGSLFRRPK